MKILVDGTVSFEVTYDPKKKLFVRKIRKDGYVVDVEYIDESKLEDYFSDGELRTFKRYWRTEDDG